MTNEKPTRRLLIFALLFATLFVFGAARSDDDTIARYHSEVVKNPKSIEAWIALSRAHLAVAGATDDLSQTSAAESTVVEAMAIDSINVDALIQLSKVWLVQKRFDDVLLLQNEALRQDPREALSWALLGDAFFEMGRYRAADSCYFVMFELDPGFDSLVRVAKVEFELREFDGAVAQMERAIDLAAKSLTPPPDVADAHVQLAEFYFWHGRTQDTRTSVRRALKIVPNSLRALRLQAELLALTGDRAASHKIYTRLAGLSSHPEYLFLLGRSHARMKKPALASDLYAKANDEYYKLMTAHPDATIGRRVDFMLASDTDIEVALELIYKYSRRRRDIHTYDRLAWAYYKNKKYDTAWSCISLALRHGAKHPRLFYRAAVIAKAAGKSDKYATFSAKARSLNPHLEKLYGPMGRQP